MTMNYNASQVGVPYVRVNNISITYPTQGNPVVGLNQTLAIKGADDTIYEIGQLETLRAEIDLVADGTTPIPLVSPEDASFLGTDTTLQQTFLAILAVVRHIQNNQPE